MKFPIYLILGLFPFFLMGQTYSVSGSVKDASGKALPFANVVLLNVSDSTQVSGISADDEGRFELKNIKPDVYYLVARYFGYRSLLVGLEIKSNIRIGAMVLEEDGDWLDAVVLQGRAPKVERKADRIVFTVANTILSEGSAMDILRNVPGVITVQDQMEIRGQVATIYLNNRKIHLSQDEIQDFLKGLTGNMITAVEVIPNPPASYEAEDGPILNIRTSGNLIPGYKGSIRAQYEQAIFPKYSFGTSHYYKTDKFSIFGNYVVNPRKEFSRSDIGIQFINPGNNVFAIWDTDHDKTTRSWAHQANLILDYTPSTTDLFNFTANASTTPNKEVFNEVSTTMRNGAGQIDSTLQNTSDLRDDLTNLSLDLTYEKRLKKEGASLKANAHYTYYDLSRQQQGASDYFDATGNFLRTVSFATDANQDIKIYTGQLDYYTPIKSGSFESGVKGSFIDSGSGIDYLNSNNNEPPFDIALTDQFFYKENVLAAYASFSWDWDTWALKMGLRAEQTDVEARSETLSEINNQNYFELFPSLFFTKKMGENHSLTFDYSRKLARPKYSDLNPFRYFLNENDFDEGNPNLVPNFSHNFNLNFNIKDTYFIDFYYRDNGNYISRITFQDNRNQTLREIKQNVLESTSYGLDFTVSTAISPRWYLYWYNSVFYEDETFLAIESTINDYTNKVKGYFGYLSNSITLSKDGTFKGDASITYLSGFLYGSFQMEETITMNLGLRKSLWNKRASISLVAEDILGRANARYTSRYANQDNSIFGVPETQFARLSFTYNFGNYNLSNINRSLDKKELDRLNNE